MDSSDLNPWAETEALGQALRLEWEKEEQLKEMVASLEQNTRPVAKGVHVFYSK